MKKPTPFATEVELCAAFLAAVDAKAWTAYAETANWDILLVRNRDGFQIGIEAKLRLNALVISQAIEEYGTWNADRAGRALAGHPRVKSADSAGWDAAARREWKRDGETSCHVAYRSKRLRRWYLTQREHLGLFA